uniref:NADH dehydrogenase subunit 6 n=1 Tax=Triatoma boliviana TaxID=3120505 RepID=UPI003002606B
MTSIMILSITTSIVFTMMKHPLSMGLTLIIQTIMVSIMTGLMINVFWFSYILIISMLSGALVLFTYMASVASNEKFHTSMQMMIFIMMILIPASISFFLVDQLENKMIWSTMKKDMLSMEYTDTLLKLFNLHNLFITILMISYLFLTMIAVTYVTNIYEGPLRMKN